MKKIPEALNRIADVVLSYRPKDKRKKLAAKSKKVKAKKRKKDEEEK